MAVAIYVGHVLDVLQSLPERSVHACVTSPPYWGLRNFNIKPLVWGGDPECQHTWKVLTKPASSGQQWNSTSTLEGGIATQSLAATHDVQDSAICLHCSAWRGSLGLEPLYDCLAWARSESPCSNCYVCHMVVIMREVWRVFRDDGVC